MTAAGAASQGSRLSEAERKELSAWLVKPAERALKDRNYALAISLFQGITAIRGEADPSMWKLAEAWILAGQFDGAAEVLARYRDAVEDTAEKARAQQKIDELEDRVEGFGGSVFRLEPARREAVEAFRRGRRHFARKQYAAAIAMYKAGYAMAPDMPGNLRELGAAYDRLGRSKEADDFFQRYLRLRPFGKNAEEVRRRLKKAKQVGLLDVVSSFPCDVVMVNRQEVPHKLPIKKLAVAPGYYKALCYSAKYHVAWYKTVEVKKGGSATLAFEFAVLENKLEPWGRIVIEYPDPERAGQMYDVGPYSEVGVPVPEDKRALRMILRSGDGSREKETYIKIEPGKRIPVTWE